MKKTLIALSSAALFTAIIFTGCSKDEDGTSPVISLTGSDVTISNIGDSYVEPGYAATDDNDGNLTSKVIVDQTSLDEDSAGTYTIYYSVSDDAGNSGRAERSVTVKNTADNFKGTYGATISCPGLTDYNYTDQVKMNATINNRIYFGKFGNYANIDNKLYVNINGGSVTIPTQTYTGVGAPAADRTFSGNGTIGTSGGVTTISLTVTESITGQSPLTCTYTFTK